MSRPRERRRGSFGQWTTRDGHYGGVRDHRGRDLSGMAAVDTRMGYDPDDPGDNAGPDSVNGGIKRRRRGGRR